MDFNPSEGAFGTFNHQQLQAPKFVHVSILGVVVVGLHPGRLLFVVAEDVRGETTTILSFRGVTLLKTCQIQHFHVQHGKQVGNALHLDEHLYSLCTMLP